MSSFRSTVRRPFTTKSARVPGAFDRLAEGVRAIHRLSPEFPVSARSTVQAGNAAHLRATVRTARDLGLRSISFLAADLTSTAFNRATVWSDRRQSLVAPDLAILEREMESLIDTDTRTTDSFSNLPPSCAHRGSLPRPLWSRAARRAALQCAVGLGRAGGQWRRAPLLFSPGPSATPPTPPWPKS